MSRGVFRSNTAPDALALDNVSAAIAQGSTLGVVGESGSGKTTLARIAAKLTPATSGNVKINDTDVDNISPRELRRKIQYIFQDPYSALNPRRTIAWSIAVPLHFLQHQTRSARKQTINGLLERTGLRPEIADRYPHELSGGQRQRAIIARAIAAEPAILILDEPTSALDVSIQAQILALLSELQRDLRLTYLFISHDLAVVEILSNHVIVMNAGRVVERGPCREVFSQPQNDYTRTLLASIPGQRPATTSKESD
jgi:peptide/nickel transport system ATP-binding protein